MTRTVGSAHAIASFRAQEFVDVRRLEKRLSVASKSRGDSCSAENHAVFADLVSRQFLSAHEVTFVPSLAEARRFLATGSFGAVLVDFDLDDGKGDELVRELVASAFRDGSSRSRPTRTATPRCFGRRRTRAVRRHVFTT